MFNDVRESPALDVLRILEQKGANVIYHDPLVPELKLDGHSYRSVPLGEVSRFGGLYGYSDGSCAVRYRRDHCWRKIARGYEKRNQRKKLGQDHQDLSIQVNGRSKSPAGKI